MFDPRNLGPGPVEPRPTMPQAPQPALGPGPAAPMPIGSPGGTGQQFNLGRVVDHGDVRSWR